MNRKERKIFIIALVLSVLLHVVGLIILNKQYLFGSTAIEKAATPEPLELVFEQPKTQPEKQIPQKFYELVENPNATGKNPQASDMLSSQSSLSQAPVIQPGQLRAVPGSDVEKNRQSQSQPQDRTQESEQKQDASESGLLAYRSSPAFNRSALTGQEQQKSQQAKPEDQMEEEQQVGETSQRPDGFNADLVGDFALSTYSWNWAPYMLAFKRKIYRVWFPPPAYSELGLIHGYTIVRFTITRAGDMRHFEVLRQVGHQSLEQSSVNAIHAMFPFLALPKEFPDDSLNITIKMIYPDLRQYNAANE